MNNYLVINQTELGHVFEDLMGGSNIFVKKSKDKLINIRTRKTATILRILPKKHVKYNGMRSMEEPFVYRGHQECELYEISNCMEQYNGEDLTIGAIVGVSDWK